VQSSIPAGTFTGNGPSATFNGMDFDFTALPAENLTVTGGGNWVKGHYGPFPNAVGFTGDPSQGQINLDGTSKTTVYTPLTSGTLGLDYLMHSAVGDFSFNGNLKYSDKVYTAVTNRQSIPSYVVVNNTLTWTPRNSRYDVWLWVLNTFNRVYLNNELETGTGDWQIYAPPRTYGVSFTARFGSEK
jgi:iron complex outermembrane recepter protein